MRGQRARLRVLVGIALLLAGLLGCSSSEMDREMTESAPGTANGVVSTQEGTGVPGIQPETTGEAHISEKTAPQPSTSRSLLLAYPAVDVHKLGPETLSRAIHANISDWPAMEYLGELAQIEGAGYEPVSVRPTEIRIVRGSSIPMSYSPELDIGKPEPNGSPGWYRGSLDKPVLFIPPNASLVMVKLETLPSPGQWAGPGEYQCPDDGTRWGYRPSEFRLGYPGLGETRVELGGDFWFGDYQAPGLGCPGNGWLYFIILGLDVDPSLLWLEYIGGTEVGQLAFWTLTERP
jgi:hypothetical protein